MQKNGGLLSPLIKVIDIRGALTYLLDNSNPEVQRKMMSRKKIKRKTKHDVLLKLRQK